MKMAARLSAVIGCTLLSLALGRPANAQVNTFTFQVNDVGGTPQASTLTIDLGTIPFDAAGIYAGYGLTTITGTVANDLGSANTLYTSTYGNGFTGSDIDLNPFFTLSLDPAGNALAPGASAVYDLGTLDELAFLQSLSGAGSYSGSQDLTLTGTIADANGGDTGVAFGANNVITPGPPSLRVLVTLTGPINSVPEPGVLQWSGLVLLSGGGLLRARVLRRRNRAARPTA